MPADGPTLATIARPISWLGARAAGGLTLPDAMPSPSQVYAPRAVWLDDDQLIVADTGNHRVLIWSGLDGGVPEAHSDADIVLGQADFSSEGAQADGRGPERGLRLPTGVIVHEGQLVIADAWNHRILVWRRVPTSSDTAPDVILGQADDISVDENRGGVCGPLTMYWPFGIGMIDGRFHVADTGNRRVLIWNGLPGPDDEPALILGQDTDDGREENRGGIGPDTFRWPHDVAGTSERLLVADAGNHRVLGWSPPPSVEAVADQVLGQTDFVSGGEFPYAPQTATAMRFPYAIAIDPEPAVGAPVMAVADTANNRILLWDRVPDASTTPADHVIGQPDFASNGENRWDLVADDTLCWPYGICLHRSRLVVADSGNNRATVWNLR